MMWHGLCARWGFDCLCTALSASQHPKGKYHPFSPLTAEQTEAPTD